MPGSPRVSGAVTPSHSPTKGAMTPLHSAAGRTPHPSVGHPSWACAYASSPKTGALLRLPVRE